MEPPDTPAPVFAVRAFKHALFGTPQPPEKRVPRAEEIRSEKRVEQRDESPQSDADEKDEKAAQRKRLRKRARTNPESSPIKPASILMTPGTANAATRRKTVSFGAQVVDNEGKKTAFNTRSGIPSNCPGKFPSPWTPKTDHAEPRVHTELTEKLLSARSVSSESVPRATSPEKPRAKDDTDITSDVLDPRSESGRYWKAQYTEYAEKSERHVKKLVAKQQLAKNYAKKKDEEARNLATTLSAERRQHKGREKELEAQMKDYQERLRNAMGENAKISMELAALRLKVEKLEEQPSKDDANTSRPVTAPEQTNTSDIWASVEPASGNAGQRRPEARRVKTDSSSPVKEDQKGTKATPHDEIKFHPKSFLERKRRSLAPQFSFEAGQQDVLTLSPARDAPAAARKSPLAEKHSHPLQSHPVPDTNSAIAYAPVTKDQPINKAPPLQTRSESTLNTKATLPPDRLAAAKAAIEKRRIAKENMKS